MISILGSVLGIFALGIFLLGALSGWFFAWIIYEMKLGDKDVQIKELQDMLRGEYGPTLKAIKGGKGAATK